MSNNVITCDFMDEAPGHEALEHEPHQAIQSGERIEWEDGDETRLGWVCGVCRHVADYGDGPRLYHTDPRLDLTLVGDCGMPAAGGPCVLPRGHNMGRLDVPSHHASLYGPTTSDDQDFGG